MQSAIEKESTVGDRGGFPRAAARAAVASLAFALCASAAPAETLEARGPSGVLLLLRSGAEVRIESADGEVLLPVSQQAKVTDFRSAGGEWLVAAVERATASPWGDRGGETALAVLRGHGDQVETLPVPATDPAALVWGPQILTRHGGLGGLLWLEGDRASRFAVRAAGWDGKAWEEPVTVSPTGPGTQIALTATALADGSWLAAWSAFDGSDDEILWSRFEGGGWSVPRPVAEDNQVPDITPHLVAAADGALVAWSRYDGNDYRVHVARFGAEGWSEPSWIGPAGSVDPAFTAAEIPILLYRKAAPSSWAVVELDAAGKVVREAEIASPQNDRPIVSALDDQEIVLSWTGATPASMKLRWKK